MFKRALLLLPLLATFACNHNSHPNSAARTAATAAMTKPFTVVTANLRNSGARDGVNAWAARKEPLIAHLQALSPDFLGVQEALPDQFDALVAAFPDFTPVGVGRDDGARKGEFAALFIRKSRFTVLKSGNFWLSSTPEVVGSVGWDAALTRICSWALVRDTVANRDLLLANTHFDHQGVKAREESGKLIVGRLKSLFPDRPLVLTGDFNSEDDSSTYASIMSTGVKDAYREIHPVYEENEASFNGFKPIVKGRRIDYIFHTVDLAPTTAEIDRTPRPTPEGTQFLSDHYFIRAKLAWK